MPEEHRARLHRRLDAAVSRELTPNLFAALLARLPAQDVEMLREWLVDEGALPGEAAERLMGTLLSAGQASELASQASAAAQAGDAAADVAAHVGRRLSTGAGAAKE